MNKQLATLVFAASAVASFAASAQDIKAPAPYSAYVQNSSGTIVRSGTGLCVHTGYWTKADAKVEGCDGYVAPPPPPPPAPAPAPVVPKAPPPPPVSEKVTFAADATFDFNKAVLKPEGKAKLDDLATKLQGTNLEAVIAVGHTDSIGSDAYNQKLSIKRAEAVKAYLVSKGVDGNKVYTEGKGEKLPVADNKTADGRSKNRRVEIEVVGSRNK